MHKFTSNHPMIRSTESALQKVTSLVARGARSKLKFPQLPQQSLCKYSTSPITDDPIYPESPNSNHSDLQSFLEYASRVDLNHKSTTFVGTHYEYIAQTALKRLGISLKRVGGKSDLGLDLIGTWTVPSLPKPLRVLVQCKALARKISPSHARELEGVFVGAPPGWRGPGVLALLISQQAATKGVREAIGRSRWPMGYVLCEGEGRIRQIMWNRRAEEEGLDGVGVGLKYLGGDENEKEVILTWKGQAINV